MKLRDLRVEELGLYLDYELVEPLPEPIPVDCVLSDWSAWGPHPTDATLEIRTRTVVIEPANGGAPCGPTEETRPKAVEPPLTDPEIGVLQTRAINRGAMLFFRDYHSGGRYSRYIRNILLPRGIVPKIQFVADSRVVSDHAFLSAHYTLTCDGVPVSECEPAAGSSIGDFVNVDLTGVSDGWHLFDIVPADGTETATPYWMHVGKVGPQAWAPTQSGSYGLENGGDANIAKWAKVPATLSPATYTLKPRTAVPFSTVPTPANLYKRDLVPTAHGDLPYLHTDETGVRTCLSFHGYAWGSFVLKRPRVVLRDGPFGVGTVVGATHLQVGRRGGIYGLDSWRMFVVGTDGSVQTLAGWRHGDNGLELIGDWSSIPEERRGFHETWGMAWDLRTVAEEALDTSVLIDRGDGTMEHPHTVGPVAFVADSQNNRIVRVQFSPTDHSAVPVCTEFLTGLNDPWDVVYIGNGQIAVSERLSHRICAYDIDTGALVRVIVEGTGYAMVDANRFVQVTGTLEQRRAEPVVAPEGLYYQDGWLYYGSYAQQQVSRVNLETGVIERVVVAAFNSKANYCKIAVSDGTFGPRGSVFFSSWESARMGGPWAFAPDGTTFSVWTTASNVLREGRGGRWADIGYSTTCAVRDGRLLCAGAAYGIAEVTAAQADDPPASDATKYKQGKSEYERAGYRLTHGIDGFGQFGYPLPLGQSEAMDYYLSANGHQAIDAV